MKQIRSEIEALHTHGPHANICPSTGLIESQFHHLLPVPQPLSPWRDAARLQNMKLLLFEKRQ